LSIFCCPPRNLYRNKTKLTNYSKRLNMVYCIVSGPWLQFNYSLSFLFLFFLIIIYSYIYIYIYINTQHFGHWRHKSDITLIKHITTIRHTKNGASFVDHHPWKQSLQLQRKTCERIVISTDIYPASGSETFWINSTYIPRVITVKTPETSNPSWAYQVFHTQQMEVNPLK
jgi:hypothetical protein